MYLTDYLKRIGWSGAVAPTVETLFAIQRAHNYTVPFENLDVQLGRMRTTSTEDAFDKIVNENRGGWCYEQNGVLGWALSQIGFDVQRIAGSVMRKQRGPTSFANHLTLLVGTPNDDTRWLVDSGFGGSLAEPIRLEEGSHHHSPFTVGLRQLDNGNWQFWESLGEGEFSFDFEDVTGDESALSHRCHYLQTSPESDFVKNLVSQMRRPDCHITLRGRVFSRTTAQGTEKRVLDSPGELVATISSEFGLDVPQVAGLWQRICERHEQVFGRSGEAN